MPADQPDGGSDRSAVDVDALLSELEEMGLADPSPPAGAGTVAATVTVADAVTDTDTVTATDAVAGTDTVTATDADADTDTVADTDAVADPATVHQADISAILDALGPSPAEPAAETQPAPDSADTAANTEPPAPATDAADGVGATVAQDDIAAILGALESASEVSETVEPPSEQEPESPVPAESAADGGASIAQGDLDALLSSVATDLPEAVDQAATPSSAEPEGVGAVIAQGDIEALLGELHEPQDSSLGATPGGLGGLSPLDQPELDRDQSADEILDDVFGSAAFVEASALDATVLPAADPEEIDPLPEQSAPIAEQVAPKAGEPSVDSPQSAEPEPQVEPLAVAVAETPQPDLAEDSVHPLRVLGKRIGDVVRPLVIRALQHLAFPLNLLPPKLRPVVDWVALSLVFWVPVVWALALLIL